MTSFKNLFFLNIIGLLAGCNGEHSSPNEYKTENVIIVVMDGARYSETWGDTTHHHIPNIAKEVIDIGVAHSQFYNDGLTKTNSGHAAITTGNYEILNNQGLELPTYPSIFQYWIQANNEDSTVAWIITSKDKLEVLSNCEDADWKGKYNPLTNCGVNGLGIGHGYRNDSLTYNEGLKIMSEFHPQLVLISFREPDYSAHKNQWDNYIKGIRDVDNYVYSLWNWIESDPIYKGKTALFVTNDHGRHLDHISNGFISHGDDCIGCTHINLFALGPDFKNGLVLDTQRGQIDISATIAELLDFDMPTGQGEIMYELFK